MVDNSFELDLEANFLKWNSVCVCLAIHHHFCEERADLESVDAGLKNGKGGIV